MTVRNMSKGESKAVYKNTNLDLRQYKRMQMFVHANAMPQNVTNLTDNQLAVFIRLGSDYKTNYYEYEIPLKLTPSGKYNDNPQDRRLVWPEENMLDIPLTAFTQLKKQRNKAKAEGRPPTTCSSPPTTRTSPTTRSALWATPRLAR